MRSEVIAGGIGHDLHHIIANHDVVKRGEEHTLLLLA